MQDRAARVKLGEIGLCHDVLLPVRGCDRCRRSSSRRAQSGDLGESGLLGKPCHVEAEGPAPPAGALMFESAAGAVSLLSVARCVPRSTDLIRNWLISLCAQASPQRCFVSGDSRRREFQPLMRNSPVSWYATNQWLVWRFCDPQILHVMTCRITITPFCSAKPNRRMIGFQPAIPIRSLMHPGTSCPQTLDGSARELPSANEQLISLL